MNENADSFMMFVLHVREFAESGMKYFIPENAAFAMSESDDEDALELLVDTLIHQEHDTGRVLANLSDLMAWGQMLAISPDLDYTPIVGSDGDMAPHDVIGKYKCEGMIDVHFTAMSAMFWHMMLSRMAAGTFMMLDSVGYFDEEE